MKFRSQCAHPQRDNMLIEMHKKCNQQAGEIDQLTNMLSVATEQLPHKTDIAVAACKQSFILFLFLFFFFKNDITFTITPL